MASSASTESPGVRRRILSRQARDAFPPMGVYAVRNLATGEVQVLASRNVPGAINRLGFELRLRQHRHAPLQQAWDRLGEEGVRIEVLQMVQERHEPGFDPDAELAMLLELWSEEAAVAGGGA